MKVNPNIVIAFFEANGLEGTVSELVFAKEAMNRRWRFDFAWPEHKVALEVDGGIWFRGKGGHTNPTNTKKDWEKQAAAAILGWRIVRCEPREATKLKTVRMVRACIDPRFMNAYLQLCEK
jgi:very-short-patch-repair endonuclease